MPVRIALIWRYKPFSLVPSRGKNTIGVRDITILISLCLLESNKGYLPQWHYPILTCYGYDVLRTGEELHPSVIAILHQWI